MPGRSTWGRDVGGRSTWGRGAWGRIAVTLALLAPGSAAAQDEPAPAGERRLLVVSFAGADQRLVTLTAERLEAALKVKVEVLAERPKPDRKDLRDDRARELPKLAEALGLESGGTPDELEKRCRAALKKDKRPQAQQVLAMLDDVCRPRLSAANLEGQVESTCGERLQAEGVIGALGVTGEDLATPDLNFVFGHGDRAKKVGVISYVRFSQGADKPKLAKRLAIQALSTTGVLLGLGRCQDAACARAFPNSLQEHDQKQEVYCQKCAPTVERALGR